MPCKHFQSALTDAAASGAPTPELRQHLTACSGCQAAFLAEQNLFASIDATLHAQVNADIPSAFVSRVQAHLAQAHLAQKRSVPQTPTWIPSWAFAAVSAAIIFFAIVFPIIKSRQPHPASPVAQLPSAVTTNKTIQNPAATPRETHGASVLIHGNRSAHPQSGSRRSAPSDLPEVIVPPTERQAFAQFVAAVQRNNIPAAADISSAVEKENPTPLIETALVHVDALAPQMEFTDFYGNTLPAGQ
jgi:hypothetical protein